MNKLDQAYAEIKPGLLMYEPDAFVTAANLALNSKCEILGL